MECWLWCCTSADFPWFECPQFLSLYVLTSTFLRKLFQFENPCFIKRCYPRRGSERVLWCDECFNTGVISDFNGMEEMWYPVQIALAEWWSQIHWRFYRKTRLHYQIRLHSRSCAWHKTAQAFSPLVMRIRKWEEWRYLSDEVGTVRIASRMLYCSHSLSASRSMNTCLLDAQEYKARLNHLPSFVDTNPLKPLSPTKTRYIYLFSDTFLNHFQSQLPFQRPAISYFSMSMRVSHRDSGSTLFVTVTLGEQLCLPLYQSQYIVYQTSLSESPYWLSHSSPKSLPFVTSSHNQLASTTPSDLGWPSPTEAEVTAKST